MEHGRSTDYSTITGACNVLMKLTLRETNRKKTTNHKQMAEYIERMQKQLGIQMKLKLLL